MGSPSLVCWSPGAQVFNLCAHRSGQARRAAFRFQAARAMEGRATRGEGPEGRMLVSGCTGHEGRAAVYTEGRAAV